MNADRQRVEALGPAERILNSLTQYTDHMVHNRPGIVVPDNRHRIGVRWEQAIWIKEGDQKVVYKVQKVGKRATKTRVGVMNGTDEVKEGARVVGRFKDPGIFPEVVTHLYQQVADVWKLDNEFATEALRTGYVPGIGVIGEPDLRDFVVDRFPAANDLPPRLMVRPKTPFGKPTMLEEIEVTELQRGDVVMALQDLSAADVKRGTPGVVFEEFNAYKDQGGPMVRFMNMNCCNVYNHQVRFVRR